MAAELAHVTAKLRPAMIERRNGQQLAPEPAPLLPPLTARDVGGVGSDAAAAAGELRTSAAMGLFDQAVCARGAYFLGSATSLFTRSILEERLAVRGHVPSSAAVLGESHAVSPLPVCSGEDCPQREGRGGAAGEASAERAGGGAGGGNSVRGGSAAVGDGAAGSDGGAGSGGGEAKRGPALAEEEELKLEL